MVVSVLWVVRIRGHPDPPCKPSLAPPRGTLGLLGPPRGLLGCLLGLPWELPGQPWGSSRGFQMVPLGPHRGPRGARRGPRLGPDWAQMGPEWVGTGLRLSKPAEKPSLWRPQGDLSNFIVCFYTFPRPTVTWLLGNKISLILIISNKPSYSWSPKHQKNTHFQHCEGQKLW